MTLYLVRHAKAGDRQEWNRDDRVRPLSRRGQRQAERLLDVFADLPVERIVSSPYVRCMETVVPLAGERGLAVEPADELAEGATLEEALKLVDKHRDQDVVMSMHGDVMPMLLEHYEDRGVPFDSPIQWPKGCTWALELDADGQVVAARYIPPPAVSD